MDTREYTAAFTRYLFIGNPETAFSPSPKKIPGFFYCDNILDGIQAAASDRYTALFVQLGCIEGMPIHALETLRQIDTNIRILLLIQMLEEPLAIRLTSPSCHKICPADDYIICPIHHEDLISYAQTVRGNQQPLPDILPTEKEILEAKIQELEQLVIQDDLTSLKNRRYLNQFLKQLIQLAEKKLFRITLLLFDIDHFKQYNDQYGHHIGDQVLRQAGQLMKRCCREHDVVARIGGDEFAVVFWDLPIRGESEQQMERRNTESGHPREPLFMAERFRREMNTATLSFLGPQGKGILTISGGLASYPEDSQSAQHLYEQADTALLEAKRSGKNQIVLIGDIPKIRPGEPVMDSSGSP